MVTKKKKFKKYKKTRRKKNNIKIKIKNLGKTKRRNKKIQYGCSANKSNMKGGDATLNPLTEVENKFSNTIGSLGGTLYGENTNNLFTNYNDYP